jgi:pimeloyl-ACP methyl ester carboxylesterase
MVGVPLALACVVSRHRTLNLSINTLEVAMHTHFIPLAVLAAAFAGSGAGAPAGAPAPTKNVTVVLVHGAFAESSSWDAVATRLLAQGYPVVAAANPLRGLKTDAEYVGTVLASIKGPIVLVGHSYAGSVITNAATGRTNVKALVYVDGTAPEVGESVSALSAQFPGGTLGPALAPPGPLPGGGKDLYIQREKYHAQFAADVPEAEAQLMFATQRPVTEAALNEPSGAPAWKTIPSWYLLCTEDKAIPAATQRYMAERANARIREVAASHASMVSQPEAATELILQAADAASPAMA